jgi:two-component system chemotaxis response regulator CheB
MERRNIVVVGASAGGLDAIKSLIAGFPPGIEVSVLIVWHMAPGSTGVLPRLLAKEGSLLTAHAVDGDPLEPGRVYVAPPDYHLLVERGRVRVTKGPKENYFRPAIDPLFRSAAIAYGPRVIGVILSGALDDGSAGLWAIKNFGGIAIVQDPAEAEVPSMPEHALDATQVDYTLKAGQIGNVIHDLSKELVDERRPHGDRKARELMQEVEVALGLPSAGYDLFVEGKTSKLTCPDCHGALRSFVEGGRLRFRCHTGHAFSANNLLDGIGLEVDEYLWNAFRASQEGIMLLNNLGDHFAEQNDPRMAAIYFNKALNMERRLSVILAAIHFNESTTPDYVSSLNRVSSRTSMPDEKTSS